MELIYRTENQSHRDKIDDFVRDWHDKSLFFSVNTSGSTGKPKTIKIQKKHAIESAKATLKALGIKNKSTALLCLSPDSIGGKMMIVRAIIAELKLIVVETSSNPTIKTNDEIDFCAMVPMQVKNTVEAQLLEKIKLLIIGGGQIDNELNDQLKHKTTLSFQTFGMTETISHIALKNINGTSDNYKALDGVCLSKSQKGTLVIDAPKIGINNLITNDIVDLIDSQTFKWLGRSDFAINSGGIKIIPEIIENKLSSYIKGNFFVFGQTDKILGQRLELIIEGPEYSLKSVDFHSILGKYQSPKRIHFTPKFISTDSGKINRFETLKKINL